MHGCMHVYIYICILYMCVCVLRLCVCAFLCVCMLGLVVVDTRGPIESLWTECVMFHIHIELPEGKYQNSHQKLHMNAFKKLHEKKRTKTLLDPHELPKNQLCNKSSSLPWETRPKVPTMAGRVLDGSWASVGGYDVLLATLKKTCIELYWL